MRIKAFEALHPLAENVDRVAAVPYDTVSAAEAKALAQGNEYSFLRISRPEVDLPDDVDIHADAVYAKAAENFAAFQKKGILIRDECSCIYVYRQKMGNHVQRGIVACSHITDYENNLIKRHEKTRADKEDDRTRHVKTLKANTGPVFLTYRDDSVIDDIVALVEGGVPFFDFTAPDGIVHTVWRVPGGSDLIAAFEEVPCSYVADGHHRAAAAVRAGIELKESNSGHTGEEEYNWFLSVSFPASQLKILPYNRCISDLNGRTEQDFLKAVKKHFDVKDNVAETPCAPRSVSMYLGGIWYGLSWPVVRDDDPVNELDVSVLQDRLFAPILGIQDPRTDKRIDFIGGIRGTDELVRRVDSGSAAVAFSMYPTTVDQMMAIADADKCMPPKSTWFEPKLRSGLLVHTL